jgi:hypothetical protein
MLKKLLIAAAGIFVAVPALADPGDWHRGHGWGHWKHYYYGGRQVVVVPAPRVYYAPPPVYYAPPPRVIYAPPPPVIYEPAVVYPAPVPPSGVSIRLHFPL